MNTKRKFRLVTAFVLFTAFLLTFFMDLTGLELHQWIGIMVGAVAAWHLFSHWQWVKTTLLRFFGKTTSQSRINLVIDAALLAGFCGILVSGLCMSTWFNLPLVHYAAWRQFHILASIATLFAVFLKLVLHWRWIVTTIRKWIAPPVLQRPAPILQTARMEEDYRMNRRDFLKYMGIVGAASAFALIKASQGLASSLAGQVAALENPPTPSPTMAAVSGGGAASPTSQPISAPTATQVTQPTPASAATSTPEPAQCTVLCPRGCAFPGECRRYVDQNGNGLCDNGECL